MKGASQSEHDAGICEGGRTVYRLLQRPKRYATTSRESLEDRPSRSIHLLADAAGEDVRRDMHRTGGIEGRARSVIRRIEIADMRFRTEVLPRVCP
ncbi:hypothetical protein EBB05_01170 [Methylobacterium brachiatum]|nr:hypothetical protein EBB05_01170 [Methylobacterium brachiatum]